MIYTTDTGFGIQHTLDASSSLPAAVNGTSTWCFVMPYYFTSTASNRNIFELRVAGSTAFRFYTSTSGTVFNFRINDVVDAQLANRSVTPGSQGYGKVVWVGFRHSYSAPTATIQVFMVLEDGTQLSSTTSTYTGALMSTFDLAKMGIGVLATSCIGAYGTPLFFNHTMDIADLAAIAALKQPLGHLMYTGGNFTGPSGCKFGMALGMTADPTDQDASASTAGFPYSSGNNSVTANNFNIYDPGVNSAYDNIFSTLTANITGSPTYLPPDDALAGGTYWVLGTSADGSSTLVNQGIAGPCPALVDLANNTPRRAWRIDMASNSRAQGTPSRTDANGVRDQETYGGGQRQFNLSKCLGILHVRPCGSGFSTFGLDLSSVSKGLTGASNCNILSSFTRFGSNASDGSTGPGFCMRVNRAATTNFYRTLVTSVPGSLFDLTQPGEHSLYLRKYPGATNVTVRGVKGTAVDTETGTVGADENVTLDTTLVTAVVDAYNALDVTIDITGYSSENFQVGHAIFCSNGGTPTMQTIAIITSVAVDTPSAGITRLGIEFSFDLVGNAAGNADGGPPAAGWNVYIGPTSTKKVTRTFDGTEGTTHRGIKVFGQNTSNPGDILVYAEEYFRTGAAGYIIGSHGQGGEGHTAQLATSFQTPDPDTGISPFYEYLAAMQLDLFIIWPAQQSSTPSSIGTITTAYRAATGQVPNDGKVAWFSESSIGVSASDLTESVDGSTDNDGWAAYIQSNAASFGVCGLIGWFLLGTPSDQRGYGYRRDNAHYNQYGHLILATRLMAQALLVAQELPGGGNFGLGNYQTGEFGTGEMGRNNYN